VKRNKNSRRIIPWVRQQQNRVSPFCLPISAPSRPQKQCAREIARGRFCRRRALVAVVGDSMEGQNRC
jgi:hypothetical protein